MGDYKNFIIDNETRYNDKKTSIEHEFISEFASNLMMELSKIKGVKQPLYPMLYNILVSRLDTLIFDFTNIVSINSKRQLIQLNYINKLYSINEIAQIEFVNVVVSKEKIKRRITDTLITFLNYINKDNSFYHMFVKEVEIVIVKYANSLDYEKFIKSINTIYVETLNLLQEERTNLINNYSVPKSKDLV